MPAFFWTKSSPPSSEDIYGSFVWTKTSDSQSFVAVNIDNITEERVMDFNDDYWYVFYSPSAFSDWGTIFDLVQAHFPDSIEGAYTMKRDKMALLKPIISSSGFQSPEDDSGTPYLFFNVTRAPGMKDTKEYPFGKILIADGIGDEGDEQAQREGSDEDMREHRHQLVQIIARHVQEVNPVSDNSEDCGCK